MTFLKKKFLLKFCAQPQAILLQSNLLLYDLLWLGIHVLYWSFGFVLSYALFAASSFRLSECSIFTSLYYRIPLQFFHFVSCDGFFVLFPPLVVSHLIFIWEGLCIYPFPYLPLLPSSYFLSLYLLLHVKNCIFIWRSRVRRGSTVVLDGFHWMYQLVLWYVGNCRSG